MVLVAVSQPTQGRLYITVIDTLLAPEVRDWLRSPFNPESEDNKKVHYMLPTADVTLTDLGPTNIAWVTADLILERHSSPSSLTMRLNQFHSTAGTFRLTYVMVRDRPRYQIVNWSIPLEPIMALADTDGSVSSLITSPVNILQLANLHAPMSRWFHTYDDDSEAPSTPDPEFGPGEDDSPPPSPIRRLLEQEDAQGDQEVPRGEE